MSRDLNIKTIVIILFSILHTTVFAGDYWVEANNGISGLAISSIAININDEIFASNNGSGVWFSQNHGANWAQVNTGLELNVVKLGVNSQNILFAGTAGNGVFRSYDNGNSWSKVKDCLDTNHYVRSIIFDKDDNIFISVDYEGVYYSSNHGETWVNIGLSNFAVIHCLAINNENTIFAGTQDKGLWKTDNLGQTWDSIGIPSISITSLLVNARGTIFAGNANGQMYRSFDNGISFYPRASLFYSVNEMIESKEGVIYAGLNVNGPYHSADFGELWGPITYGLAKRTVFTICSNSGDTTYWGTNNGVYKLLLDTKPLTPPTLAQPKNDSKNMNLNVDLKWYRCRAAENYEVEVAIDSNFANVLIFDNNILDNFYLLSGLENYIKYYWRVRSIKQTDTSQWSEVRTFRTKLQVPVLSKPDNYSINNDVKVEFLWNGILYAANYLLQIALDSNFSDTSLIYSDMTQSHNSHTFNAEYNTRYFWRMKSRNSMSESDWSMIRNFSTLMTAPILKSPVNDSKDIDIDILFDWEDYSDVTFYTFEISTDSGFINIIYTDTKIKESATQVPNLLYNTEYFWRVRVKFGEKLSYWSKIFDFASGGEPAKLTLPENNSIGQEKNLKLEWSYTKPMDNYWIEISKKSNFKILVHSDSTLLTNSFQPDSLEFSQIYYWRVKQKYNNEWSLWSEVWNFTTKNFGLTSPELLYPSNDTTEVDTALIVFWSESDNAKKYHLQISDDLNFDELIFDNEFLTENYYMLSDLNYNTKYYWRVRAIRDDEESEWSEIFSFSTKMGIGIEDLFFEKNNLFDVELYPNPVSDNLFVIVNAKSSVTYRIFLYDLLGKNMGKGFNGKFGAGLNEFEIKTDSMDNGVYFLVLSTENYSLMRMVLIRR